MRTYYIIFTYICIHIEYTVYTPSNHLVVKHRESQGSIVSFVISPFPNRTHRRRPFHYHQPLSLQRFLWILMRPLLYCNLLNFRPLHSLHVFFRIYQKKSLKRQRAKEGIVFYKRGTWISLKTHENSNDHVYDAA